MKNYLLKNNIPKYTTHRKNHPKSGFDREKWLVYDVRNVVVIVVVVPKLKFHEKKIYKKVSQKRKILTAM